MGMEEIKFKVCKACGENKHITEFYSYKSVGVKCKRCISIANKELSKIEPDFIPNEKKCIKCGEIKLINNFGSTKYTTDKHRAKCKSCCKEYRKEKNTKIIYIIPTEKPCTECKIVKLIDQFSNDKSRKDGHYPVCKACINKHHNTEEYKQYMRTWRKNNRDKLRESNKKWLKNNHDTAHQTRLKYTELNWEKIREADRKLRNTPVYKLRNSINHAMRNSLDKLKLNDPTTDLSFCITYLPYTLEQLKFHLEELFEPWMSWENHGNYDPNRKTWQIDHIIPQSLLPFDSFTHPNFLKCWALENLRPLDALENIKKGNKLLPGLVL